MKKQMKAKSPNDPLDSKLCVEWWEKRWFKTHILMYCTISNKGNFPLLYNGDRMKCHSVEGKKKEKRRRRRAPFVVCGFKLSRVKNWCLAQVFLCFHKFLWFLFQKTPFFRGYGCFFVSKKLLTDKSHVLVVISIISSLWHLNKSWQGTYEFLGSIVHKTKSLFLLCVHCVCFLAVKSKKIGVQNNNFLCSHKFLWFIYSKSTILSWVQMFICV